VPDRPVRASSNGSAHFEPARVRSLTGLATSKGSDTGSGIGVAVIDSGVSALRGFRNGSDECEDSRLAYSQNFASDAGTADLYGHGTHVASIIAQDVDAGLKEQRFRRF